MSLKVYSSAPNLLHYQKCVIVTKKSYCNSSHEEFSILSVFFFNSLLKSRKTDVCVCFSLCVCQDVAWLPTLGTVVVGYPCNAHCDMTHKYILYLWVETHHLPQQDIMQYTYEVLVLLSCNQTGCIEFMF